MILSPVVVDRFLRRSGSRVSIPMACRRTVPTEHVASVKSLYPLGQPEKALGHEPQIDLCVANQATATACQLSGTDQCRRYSIKMQPRWNHAGPAAQSKGRKPKPDGAQNEPGAGSQGITLSFQSREKNVLDIPSYRSGHFTHYAGSECKRDFSQTTRRCARMPDKSVLQLGVRNASSRCCGCALHTAFRCCRMFPQGPTA